MLTFPTPSPLTRTQPAKARTRHRAFTGVKASLNNRIDKTMTMLGAVYSKIAAMDRVVS